MSAPNDAVWYISRDGQQFGPFSAGDFAGFLERRQLRPTDQVWQAGMDAWIAYSDYEARKTAARFVEPHGPSSSTKTDLVRGGLRVSTKTLTAAFHRVSTHLAKYATPRAMADRKAKSIRPTTRHGSSDVIADNSTQDQHGSMPDLKTKDVVEPLRRSSSTPRLDDQHGSMPDLKTDIVEPLRRLPSTPRLEDQRGSMPDLKIKDVVQPLRRLPSTPRLASEGEAADHIGLELSTFRAWVADGRLPRPLPDCAKYDIKAIHLALDLISGIGPREKGSNEWSERLARGLPDPSQEAPIQARQSSSPKEVPPSDLPRKPPWSRE